MTWAWHWHLTWQDPAALALALAGLAFAWWLRRTLAVRGGCDRCGDQAVGPTGPTRVDVGRLRIGQRR